MLNRFGIACSTVVATVTLVACGSETPKPPPSPPKPLTFEGKRLNGWPADAKADGFTRCEPTSSNSSEPAYQCFHADRHILGVEADAVSVTLEAPFLESKENPEKKIAFDGIRYDFPEPEYGYDCKDDPAVPFKCYQHAERLSQIHVALVGKGYRYYRSRYGWDYYSRREPIMVRVNGQNSERGSLTVSAMSHDDWQDRLKRLDEADAANRKASSDQKAFVDSMAAPTTPTPH